MAEAAGLAIGVLGLVGLFDACITAFDLVQVARTQDRSFEVLCACLDLAKARFSIWGQALGLDDPTSHDPRLDDPALRETIARTCRLIVELFDDCKKYEGRYGLKRWFKQLRDDSGTVGKEYHSPFRATFARMRRLARRSDARSDGTAIKQRRHVVRWVIVDKNAFAELVDQLQKLIEGLEAVSRDSVPNFTQRRATIARLEVESIPDEDSLQLLQEASINGDDDAISDAISSRVLSESLRTGDDSHLPTTLAVTSASGSFFTASEGSKHKRDFTALHSADRASTEWGQNRSNFLCHMGSGFASTAEEHLANIHEQNVRDIRHMLSTYTDTDVMADMLPETIEAAVVSPLEQNPDSTCVTWNIIPHRQRTLRGYLPIKCSIAGPPGSPYEDDIFQLIIFLHADGSVKTLTFMTHILHPRDGRVYEDYAWLSYLNKPGPHGHLNRVLRNVRLSLIRLEDSAHCRWTQIMFTCSCYSMFTCSCYSRARQITSIQPTTAHYLREVEEHYIARLWSFLSDLEEAKLEKEGYDNMMDGMDTSITIFGQI